jgi:hypothetical protein
MTDSNASMSQERAVSINWIMVEAWCIQNGLKNGPVPDIRGFSAEEAESASIMMRDYAFGSEKRPDGSTRLTSFVEPTRVVPLYAWALAAWADGGGGYDVPARVNRLE